MSKAERSLKAEKPFFRAASPHNAVVLAAVAVILSLNAVIQQSGFDETGALFVTGTALGIPECAVACMASHPRRHTSLVPGALPHG